MVRRYNAGRVKRHRIYSIPEAAALLGVHKHTITRWLDDGLPVIERKRPLLIHGTDLRDFIKARQPKKQPCRPGEMFCVRCSAPKRPAYDVADFIPSKAGRGLLRGLCPVCGGADSPVRHRGKNRSGLRRTECCAPDRTIAHVR